MRKYVITARRESTLLTAVITSNTWEKSEYINYHTKKRITHLEE